MGELIEQQPQQIAAQAQTQSNSIMEFIQRAASDNTVDIDKLERLIVMSEKMQAKNAEQAFNAAMAAMQSDMPTVNEGAINQHTKNAYANLDDINRAIKPVMQKHGFALTFKVDHQSGGISVTGILMHAAGHREETTLLLPVDTGAGRNAVQAVGSSATYGKRYVMCALLNISTGDAPDDDGVAADEPVITEAQAKSLQAVLDKCSDRAKGAFEKMHGSAGQVAKSAYDSTMAMLKKSAARNQAKAQ